MCWFKKEKKRQYPAVYSEWVYEFGRLGKTLFQARDAEMLGGGVLKDSKYSIKGFKADLSAFLEGQLGLFLEKYKKDLATHLESADCEYLMLVIRRASLRYRDLFFFEGLSFLDKTYKKELGDELREKWRQYHEDLLDYFKRLEGYTDALHQVTVSIQRLLQA